MSEMTVVSRGVTIVSSPEAIIAYSGRDVGNVDYRFGEPNEVKASRDRLIEPLAPLKYVVQRPNGGSEFMDLSNIPDEELPEEPPTDGLFIDRSGIALGLNAADCVATALYSGKTDSSGPVLGVIHAGRRGVDGGIHVSAAQHMAETHGVAKSEVNAYFGPCISSESYCYPTISAEQLADPKWNRFIDKRGGNYHIDLLGRVIKDLSEFGLEPDQIELSGADTGAEGSGYFSHTRSNRYGEPEARNGFVAMLTD